MTAQVKFTALDQNHVPWSKYRHEIEQGACRVTVTDYDGSKANPDPWTEIQLDETYTIDGGKRPVCRTIHMTLNAAQREELLQLLLRERGKDVAEAEAMS